MKVRAARDIKENTLLGLEEKEKALRAMLRECRQVIVAYSGGVDSTLVAQLAYEELGTSMQAVIAKSPSLPESEWEAAHALASKQGFPLRVLHTREHENPAYQKNSSDRCYYCKTELYGKLVVMAQNLAGECSEDSGQAANEKNKWIVLDGANCDDLGDHRPGRVAASEHAVRSLLIEAGLSKQEVRRLALRLGLANHDKPAAPCLASRLPYGTAVTPEVLSRIERAEAFLRGEFGLRDFRVRSHEDLARIEILPEDFSLLVKEREQVAMAFRGYGFKYVTLDLLGFRSGSLNEFLGRRRGSATH